LRSAEKGLRAVLDRKELIKVTEVNGEQNRVKQIGNEQFKDNEEMIRGEEIKLYFPAGFIPF